MTYLWRFCATLSLCGTIISLGIALVVHGATLLQLQSALNIDMAAISFIFPAFGIGNVLGTFPAAAGVGGRGRRRHVISCLLAATAGIMMGLIPNSRYLPVLIMAFGVFGFSYGYLDTDLTTVVTELWGDRSDSYLVALRSSSSIGIFIGGFICVPFVESIPHSPPTTTNPNYDVTVTSFDVTIFEDMTSNNSPVAEFFGLSKLQCIYIISMSIILVMSLFMLIMMMRSSLQIERTEEEERLITALEGSFSSQNVAEQLRIRRERVLSRPGVIIIITLLCVVVGTTMGSTGAFCNYVAAFTTVYLKRSPEEGALLVSLYGGCTLLSNSIVTLVVKVIQPQILVIFTIVSSLTAFTIISIIPQESVVIWVITALFGLGNIPTMCLMYVCAEKFGFLTMKVAGAFAFSAGLAAFLSTMTIGMMFEQYPMFVMYYCLGCSAVGALAFLLAMLTNQRSSSHVMVSL